jgi:hypothetical protein
MYEENFIRDEMPVKLDVDAGREVLIAHHKIRRATILTVDLDDERSFAGIAPDSPLSVVRLKHQTPSLCRRLHCDWGRRAASGTGCQRED